MATETCVLCSEKGAVPSPTCGVVFFSPPAGGEGGRLPSVTMTQRICVQIELQKRREVFADGYILVNEREPACITLCSYLCYMPIENLRCLFS